jgi:hypothetical protein
MMSCDACGRYVLEVGPCPFCAAGVVLKGAMVGASVLVLAACYGPPPSEKDDECVAETDAVEVCDDGVDNDCDGLTDVDDDDCPAP